MAAWHDVKSMIQVIRRYVTDPEKRRNLCRDLCHESTGNATVKATLERLANMAELEYQEHLIINSRYTKRA